MLRELGEKQISKIATIRSGGLFPSTELREGLLLFSIWTQHTSFLIHRLSSWRPVGKQISFADPWHIGRGLRRLNKRCYSVARYADPGGGTNQRNHWVLMEWRVVRAVAIDCASYVLKRLPRDVRWALHCFTPNSIECWWKAVRATTWSSPVEICERGQRWISASEGKGLQDPETKSWYYQSLSFFITFCIQ